MISKKYLRNCVALSVLPEISHILKDLKAPSDISKVRVSHMNDIERVIFAPDPKTGVARADLALILSKNSHPEIADYIQRNLLGSLPDSVGTDNPDFAIEGVKSRFESVQDFAIRLREFAKQDLDSK